MMKVATFAVTMVLMLRTVGVVAAEDAAAAAPPNNVAYFAIEAGDVQRAKRFYESVFGWQFIPLTGEDYFLIRTGSGTKPGIVGGLQPRIEPLTGTGYRAFVCTIAVSSIEAIATRIERNGGRIVEAPHEVAGIGTLLYFVDPEGNRVGAMEYVIPL